MNHNRKSAYQEYLRSEHWSNLKAITKKPPECSGCARAVPLQLHHLYYRETWQDSCPKDLLWICAECHTLFHMAFGTNLKQKTTYLKSSRAFIRRFAVSFLRAAATAKGGWGRKQLAEWGVPWPPPKGWKDRLEMAIKRTA
jgi:hypothetical protein